MRLREAVGTLPAKKIWGHVKAALMFAKNILILCRVATYDLQVKDFAN